MPNFISSLNFQNNCGCSIGSGHTNKYIIQYNQLITLENLYRSWEKFKKSKSSRDDVDKFAVNLFTNLLKIKNDLEQNKFVHDSYQNFIVFDVKTRIIHKATIRDRIVNRLMYDELVKIFDKKFIFDSYSCRKGKGTLRALERYKYFFGKITKNYTKQAWVLKFDIKKCFQNVDTEILKNLLQKQICESNFLNLNFSIIDSFKKYDMGLPLGNLTSQIYLNIYLHQLDFYCKNTLKIKYYIRYADDVVCMFESEEFAEETLKKILEFTKNKLKIELHKIQIKTIYSGTDFLGWKHYKSHRTMRKNTASKMIENLSDKNITSYLGLLNFGSGYKLQEKIKKMI